MKERLKMKNVVSQLQLIQLPEPEEATQEVVEEEVEGDFLEEDESFDDLDSVIDELFTDDEEESNEE